MGKFTGFILTLAPGAVYVKFTPWPINVLTSVH